MCAAQIDSGSPLFEIHGTQAQTVVLRGVVEVRVLFCLCYTCFLFSGEGELRGSVRALVRSISQSMGTLACLRCRIQESK